MSDGQFSAKPMRTSRSRDFVSSAGEFSTEARLSTDATRSFSDSPAVLRELRALTDVVLPEIGHRNCVPLPRSTPSGALEMGRPIASAVLVQEYLIGLVFLRVAGWVFIVCGGMFMLFSCAILIAMLPRGQAPGDPPAAIAIIGAIGLLIAAVGAWFGIFRGRVVNEMCWFCPRGMIWRTERVFEWYPWEEITELYCNLQVDRPAIGIRFDKEVSWITFANTDASRRMVEYFEKLASASCMPAILQMIAEGNTVRFGDWRLSRYSLRGPDEEINWRDVVDVGQGHQELRIRHREQKGLSIELEAVPYPSLFAAIAAAAFAFERGQY